MSVSVHYIRRCHLVRLFVPSSHPSRMSGICTTCTPEPRVAFQLFNFDDDGKISSTKQPERGLRHELYISTAVDDATKCTRRSYYADELRAMGYETLWLSHPGVASYQRTADRMADMFKTVAIVRRTCPSPLLLIPPMSPPTPNQPDDH